MLGGLKSTHHLTPETWKYVPLQDFTEQSDIDWNLPVEEIDAILFRKYGLSSTEQDFIKEKVQAMPLAD